MIKRARVRRPWFTIAGSALMTLVILAYFADAVARGLGR